MLVRMYAPRKADIIAPSLRTGLLRNHWELVLNPVSRIESARALRRCPDFDALLDNGFNLINHTDSARSTFLSSKLLLDARRALQRASSKPGLMSV
ncbi:hypothetical protein LY76DRAFT_685454 [Colletotrichum caudatum]|nr:hypothetical protein LY76DRAFT_685454 [Colletotrichum caudatum]